MDVVLVISRAFPLSLMKNGEITLKKAIKVLIQNDNTSESLAVSLQANDVR